MTSIRTLVLISILFSSGCALFVKKTVPFKPEVVFIKGGLFYYGDFYDSTNTDALPLHEVKVDDFSIGKYEVTNEEFRFFVKSSNYNDYEERRNVLASQPVTNVTWIEAKTFCEFWGMRLPTEVEWEYAARSRGKNQIIAGTNNLEEIEDYAISRKSSYPAPATVGSKKPNELGLYDMSGNVFEWIDEFYQFYSRPEWMHDNESDAVRIIRGGSYTESIVANRTYWRVGTLKTNKANDIGFRCVVSK